MIHYRPAPGQHPEYRAPACDASVYRECCAAMETLTAHVGVVRRAADESLRRALDAPQPHETTNTMFVALWEAHLHDRETLFAAMRRLDEAREELRRIVAAHGAKPDPSPPTGPRLPG